MKRLGKKKRKFREMAEAYRGSGAMPPCPHFGVCGGCLLQDIPYEGQLQLKKDYLNGLLGSHGSVDAVHPSNPFGYRTRMDMVCAFGKTGLREAGSYKFVVDVEHCPLMQERMEQSFLSLRPLLVQAEQYDYLRHNGYLRYLVLRQGAFSGELMLNLVVSRPENALGEILERACDLADSVSILVSEGLADLSYGPVLENIKRGWINENFDSTIYRITPNSFFQSNCEIALRMYRRIKDNIRGRVLDLFCGVGSISLFIAGAAEHVTGVEINPEAVDAAVMNAELNGIGNTEFIRSDALDFIRETQDSWDTMVLDPPRSGMHPKTAILINTMGPQRIVYMSCNPSTFREDLERLTNYRVESIEAFDMFPQTPHLETLAILERI